MGFEAPRSIYTLDFEDTELDGLVVKMTGGKLGDAFATVRDAGKISNGGNADYTVADAEVVLSQYEDMAEHLISWNLTAGGEPVDATLDGLKTLEVRHVNMIAAAWQQAQVNVPRPLPHASSSTPETDLSSIRMETLPASLAS